MAHKTKYIVKLSKDEREKLNKIVKTGRVQRQNDNALKYIYMLTKALMALRCQT